MRSTLILTMSIVVALCAASCRKEEKDVRLQARVLINGEAYESSPDVQRPSDSSVHFNLRRINSAGNVEMEFIVLYLPRRSGVYQLRPDGGDSNGHPLYGPIGFLGTSRGGDVTCGDWLLLTDSSSKSFVRVEKSAASSLEGTFSATFLKTNDCAVRKYPDTLKFTDGHFRFEF